MAERAMARGVKPERVKHRPRPAHRHGSRPRPPRDRDHHPLLDLQRQAGNAAVTSLVQGRLTVQRDDKGDERQADGKRLYTKAEDAFMADDFAHAYDFLVAAYELKPYQQLKYDMAQCLRKLGGRREQAIKLYKEFIASGSGEPANQKKAREFVAELTGPGSTGDKVKDNEAGAKIYSQAEKAYTDGDYGHALDLLQECYGIVAYEQFKFDMAQCLRKLGGRRAETIKLYKEFIASGSGEARHQKEAKEYVVELSGPGSTGDETKDRAAGSALYTKAEDAWLAQDYAAAFDFLQQCYEITKYAQLQYDMAQCLRRLGGRRMEAIALYKGFIASGSGEPANQVKAKGYLRELMTQGASYD